MSPFVALRATLSRSCAAVLALGCAAVVAGCVSTGSSAPMHAIDDTRGPIPVAALPGWGKADADSLHAALSRQCESPRAAQQWPELCMRLPAKTQLVAWIAERFDAWPLSGVDGRRQGLLTGYYEPIVRGTRERVDARQVPLYRRPSDLVATADGARMRSVDGRIVGPYPTRARIESDGLPAAEVLLWIDDPIEAFFLHVQGSGRVRLPDGEIVRVGFADHNGHAYRAIGRELIERGALVPEAVDAESIKAWLRANPAHAQDVLHSNARFIFFRPLPVQDSPSATIGPSGPPGSLGVPLTPMRSVATDPAHVPPGSLLFVDSTHPFDGAPMRRAVVSQDRGAAIVGAVRADLFWGSGDEAGRLAGRTKQPARIWLLWPKGARPPGH